jgi:flagellar protein FliS
MIRTDLAYRRTAAEAASGMGLLIALFDTLAGDLRRAAEAQRENDIERRSREAGHALRVLGFLENRVASATDGELARELIAFYSSLRRKLIEASARKSAGMLEQMMADVLKLREQWQQIEQRNEPSGPEILRPVIQIPAGYPAPQIERIRSNWSA